MRQIYSYHDVINNEHTCSGCPLKSVYTGKVNVPLGPASSDRANENIWDKVSADQRLQRKLNQHCIQGMGKLLQSHKSME